MSLLIVVVLMYILYLKERSTEYSFVEVDQIQAFITYLLSKLEIRFIPLKSI